MFLLGCHLPTESFKCTMTLISVTVCLHVLAKSELNKQLLFTVVKITIAGEGGVFWDGVCSVWVHTRTGPRWSSASLSRCPPQYRRHGSCSAAPRVGGCSPRCVYNPCKLMFKTCPCNNDNTAGFLILKWSEKVVQEDIMLSNNK